MKAATQKAPAQKLKKEEQLQRDKKRAVELATVIGDLNQDLDEIAVELQGKLKPFEDEYLSKITPIRDLYNPRVESISASKMTAEKELLEIAARQRKTMFGVDGNWHFDNGLYLHVKGETVVKTGPSFDLAKFVKKFSDYVKVTYRIKELKALFTDADARKKSKIEQFDIDLKVEESIEIKTKAKD